MLIVYVCRMHSCVLYAKTDEFTCADDVVACVNQWEVQDKVWSKLSFMPS